MAMSLRFVLFVVVACISAVYAGYPTNVTVAVKCHELSVVATWNKTAFYGGNVTKIIWNDPLCDGFTHDEKQVWASTTFNSCKSEISQFNDTILQENTAKVYVTYRIGLIERVVIYSFITQCTMLRSIHTPGGVSYNVTEREVVGGNATEVTDFNVRMDIYDDNSFGALLGNRIVSAFDPIYIKIHEIHDNQLLKFVTHQCFATRTSNREDTSYLFFNDKCPIDTTFKAIASDDGIYRFQINAFRFIQLSTSVFIHCKLSVCKMNSTVPACKQECPPVNRKRKRRAITLDADSSNEEPLEEITVMSEKITFMKATCEEMNCPQYSTCIDLVPPVCRCGYGYVYKAETNQCSNERTFTITGLHFDMQFENAFLDPYSREFMRLATRIETQLGYFVALLKDDSIEGMKVIRAREGSVVVDIDIIYAQKSTKKDAYSTFLKSITNDHTGTVDYADELMIKANIPTMKESAANSETVLILSVAIPAFAVLVMVVIIGFVVRHRRSMLK